MNLEVLRSLKEEINVILKSNTSWEKKYDAIYCTDLSFRVFQQMPDLHLSFCKQDATHQDDIMLFVISFKDKLNKAEALVENGVTHIY